MLCAAVYSQLDAHRGPQNVPRGTKLGIRVCQKRSRPGKKPVSHETNGIVLALDRSFAVAALRGGGIEEAHFHDPAYSTVPVPSDHSGLAVEPSRAAAVLGQCMTVITVIHCPSPPNATTAASQMSPAGPQRCWGSA